MEVKDRLRLLPPLRASRPPTRREGAWSLDELRLRLHAATGLAQANEGQVPRVGKRQVERRAPCSVVDALPFQRCVTPYGEIYHRRELLSLEGAPLASAFQLQPELLALLALDPQIAHVAPAQALYLDTETTGLGLGAGTFAFLVGMAQFDEHGLLWLEQLLLAEPSSERALLFHLDERVRQASLLVTFNGKAYDWPLLSGRHVMVGGGPLPTLPHVDLLHVCRRLHRSRLQRFTLKHLEAELLGFQREADIEGSEVASRYLHFLRTSDAACLQQVVEHNRWDVASMVRLAGLYAEPLQQLAGSDLIDLARVFQRAGNLPRAETAVERAIGTGVGGPALTARGRLAKLRGDRARALADFEDSLRSVDDAPTRLELAKLYEHYLKDPLKALAVMPRAGVESEQAVVRRERRLRAKAAVAGARQAGRLGK